MYESYWQLETKPFENTADPRFYFPGDAQQGALLKLRYAIENRRGAAILTGPPGLGKTLLARTLATQLPDRFSPVGHLVFPQMPASQLLAYIAGEIAPADEDAAGPTPSIQQSIRRIASALEHNAAQQRHAVLIIDEAHLLLPEQLETLRLLLNFEYDQQPALTLLLTGDTTLLPVLERMPQLEQRMGVKCLLRPFTLEETVSYVNHRLHTAGAGREIFAEEAIESLHYHSGGAPRQINRLGDLALLIGYAEEHETISASHINDVAAELFTVSPE